MEKLNCTCYKNPECLMDHLFPLTKYNRLALNWVGFLYCICLKGKLFQLGLGNDIYLPNQCELENLIL